MRRAGSPSNRRRRSVPRASGDIRTSYMRQRILSALRHSGAMALLVAVEDTPRWSHSMTGLQAILKAQISAYGLCGGVKSRARLMHFGEFVPGVVTEVEFPASVQPFNARRLPIICRWKAAIRWSRGGYVYVPAVGRIARRLRGKNTRPTRLSSSGQPSGSSKGKPQLARQPHPRDSFVEGNSDALAVATLGETRKRRRLLRRRCAA